MTAPDVVKMKTSRDSQLRKFRQNQDICVSVFLVSAQIISGHIVDNLINRELFTK